ncbi:MAG: type II toxin-antitoxin system ParD family antitoxin [Chloroflexota bacterium]
MPTRNISLTDRLNEFVDSAVADGQFQNASEVVRASLRLLEQQRREDVARLEALRAAVDVGLEELNRGEGVTVALEDLGDFITGIGERVEQRLARQ